MRHTTRFAIGLGAVGMLTWAAGCSHDSTGVDTTAAAVDDTGAVVSNAGQVPPSSTLPIAALRADDGSAVVHVALPPGTAPEGARARVRNARVGSEVWVTMRDGGFDPVPVVASAGDVLDVEVRRGDGSLLSSFARTVPASRPPRVVRTIPPRGKTRIPLNLRVGIVFSEPIAVASLTPGTLRLLRGNAAVSGTVRLVPGSGTLAIFVPDAPLAANTTYRLEVSRGVTDVDGAALAASLTSTFTTGTGSTGAPESIALSVDTVRMVTGTYQLSALAFDAAGNALVDQPVTWRSLDEEVVRVSPTGLVTARGEGYGYFVSASIGGVERFVFVVIDLPTDPATVEIDAKGGEIVTGESATFAAVVRDAEGRRLDREVSWRSSDETVATVDAQGRVFAVRPGSVTITATSASASGAVSVSIVRPPPPTSITIVGAYSAMLVGYVERLDARLFAAGRSLPARAYPVSWSSKDPGVATVVAVDTFAVVRATGVGSTEITATVGEVSASVTVTVSGMIFYSVASGYTHSCGLDQTGAAHCWGFVGDPRPEGLRLLSSAAPRRVAGDRSFVALTAGGQFTCGLTVEGTAFCWGWNRSGSLGTGSEAASDMEPKPVAGGHTFVSLHAGDEHACGLTNERLLYCWGANGLGQLGTGSRESSSVPVAVSRGLHFSRVSAGSAHTCAVVAESGRMHCWGSNEHGQLGTGSPPGSITVPTQVDGALQFHSVVASRGAHTCGITYANAAYCWGAGGAGQLGDGRSVESRTPVRVEGPLEFMQLVAGWAYTCGLTADGQAYCWGSGAEGELGAGGTFPVHQGASSAVPVAVLGGLFFDEITAGAYHACGLTASTFGLGTAYCWGDNGLDQLGAGSQPMTHSSVPVKVTNQL